MYFVLIFFSCLLMLFGIAQADVLKIDYTDIDDNEIHIGGPGTFDDNCGALNYAQIGPDKSSGAATYDNRILFLVDLSSYTEGSDAIDSVIMFMVLSGFSCYDGEGGLATRDSILHYAPIQIFWHEGDNTPCANATAGESSWDQAVEDTTDWTINGCDDDTDDYDGTAEDSIQLAYMDVDSIFLDITIVATEWIAGTRDNYGLLFWFIKRDTGGLASLDTWCGVDDYLPVESSTAAWRPYVKIYYSTASASQIFIIQ